MEDWMSIKFVDVINQAYLEYERQVVKGRSTVSDFARWLGMPQSNVSHWMNGQRPPGKHMKALARKLSEVNVKDKEGNILVDFRAMVYEALEEDEPMTNDPLARRILVSLRRLTPEQRKQIVDLVEQKAKEEEDPNTGFRFQTA
jgi:transposase-like protein